MAVTVIKNISLDAIDGNTARASWVGDADARAWVALDGKFVAQALRHSGTDKSADISLATDTPRALDILECPAGEVPTEISMRPELRPLVFFDAVAAAESYRVYRQDGTNDEREMARIGETGAGRYSARPASNLNGKTGVWHHFRVEAVDAYGAAKTSETKHLYVVDVPPGPDVAGATVINGEVYLYVNAAPVLLELPVYVGDLPGYVGDLPACITEISYV